MEDIDGLMLKKNGKGISLDDDDIITESLIFTKSSGRICTAANPFHFHWKLTKGDIDSGSVKIPDKFVELNGDQLTGQVCLRVRDHATFDVRLRNSSTGIWFAGSGFKQFIMQYHLKVNHLLHFSYVGDSKFSVIVHGKGYCESDYNHEIRGFNIRAQEELPVVRPPHRQQSQTASRQHSQTANAGEGYCESDYNHEIRGFNIRAQEELPVVRPPRRRQSQTASRQHSQTANANSPSRPSRASRRGDPAKYQPITIQEDDELEDLDSDSSMSSSFVESLKSSDLLDISMEENQLPTFSVTLQPSTPKLSSNLSIYFDDEAAFMEDVEAGNWTLHCNGETWKVGVSIMDCRASIKAGWEKFLRDNNLHGGGKLVFRVNEDTRVMHVDCI